MSLWEALLLLDHVGIMIKKNKVIFTNEANWRGEFLADESKLSINELTCKIPSGWGFVLWSHFDAKGRSSSGVECMSEIAYLICEWWMGIYSGEVCEWNDEVCLLSDIMRQPRVAVLDVGLSNKVAGSHINSSITSHVFYWDVGYFELRNRRSDFVNYLIWRCPRRSVSWFRGMDGWIKPGQAEMPT